MAKVVAVNISATKGVIKEPIEKGYFAFNHGLEGDAHAGDWQTGKPSFTGKHR